MEKKPILSRFPDALVLLVFLILIATLLTYFVPAGAYDRAEDAAGKMVVVPGTYHTVEQTPFSGSALFLAIPSGMSSAATIIFFLLIIGGAFGVITGSGALEALAGRTITKFKNSSRANLIVAGLIIFFGLVSSVMGMYGECLVFIPILMVLMISLGFDALVGVAIVLCGISAGYGAATMNPFTVQLAQGIVGIPLLSGLSFRWVFWVVQMAVLIWYILRYCNKVKADPANSLVKGTDYSDLHISEGAGITQMNKRHVAVLLTFFASLLLLMVLMIKLKFNMNQISAYFLLVGIVCGIVYGMHVNDMVEHFMSGAKTMVYPALLVGFAATISVVLQAGQILDTIVYYTSQPLLHLPKAISAAGMVIFQALVSLFIPSGSGQAMVVMPIMGPLSDVLGFSRQVAILAYQMGDGFFNLIVPTLGIMMAGIGMGRIPYPKWLKFAVKLVVIQTLISMVFCVIAVAIGLQ